MTVSGASKPSSKVLSLVCFFFLIIQQKRERSYMTDVLAVSRRNDLNLNKNGQLPGLICVCEQNICL